MNFIMCNLSDPAMNDIRVRQAMAMAINPKQYSTVVDKSVNTPTNQPFVKNTPYYVARRRVPGLQPEQGQGPGEAARDRDGQGGGLLVAVDQLGLLDRGRPVPPEPARGGGDEGHADAGPAGRPDQQRPGRAVPGHLVAAVRSGGPRPQLPVVEPDRDLRHLVRVPIASNFARNTDPQVETFLQQGRTSTDPATRAAAYQGVAKRLNVDLPYIWQDRATWAIVANSKVQNWNNPTTPEGAKAYGMIVGTIWTPQIWKST